MANLKGSGKGGRPRIYGDGTPAERAKLARERLYAGKIKFNALLPKEVYERLLKLEADNGFKFHTDFFVELLDVYESTAGIREMVRVRNNI